MMPLFGTIVSLLEDDPIPLMLFLGLVAYILVVALFSRTRRE